MLTLISFLPDAPIFCVSEEEDTYLARVTEF
jgi:hypothetical protein